MFTSAIVEKWFTQRYGTPTEIQARAWPFIARGEHVLIAAPTGSGKTLTAFLPSIDRFMSGELKTGQASVLYISPLKALNVDIGKNLLRPLREIAELGEREGLPIPEIRVFTRSGDTPSSERQRMLKRPPEILITTPESLSLLLNSPKAQAMLSNIRTVILDEIHAVAGEKRGTFLMCSVERLRLLAGDFQRIVVSATVRPLSTVADFAFGSLREGDAIRKRDYRIVESDMKRELSLSIVSTERNWSVEDPQTIWPALIDRFKDIIKRNRSTIIFSNSRRQTEKITYYLNEHEERELAYSHHGSLSKEVRSVVEERLKAGQLPAIVATGSLELGIDIGFLDEVILSGTPPTVAQTIQRIGRAGHSVGGVSRGTLFPLHGKDILCAAAMAEAVAERDIEDLRIVESPLDVLAQEILGMVSMREYPLDELFAFFTSIYPYRHLERRNFDLVVEMLAGKYAGSRIRELYPLVSVDKLTKTARGKEGALKLLYLSGGTIPDRGSYTLRLAGDRSRIGELDEEFVWERKVGDTFTLGTQCWKVVSIDSQSVHVIPWERSINIIPFWKAENQFRAFSFSERILDFLDCWNERLLTEEGHSAFTRELSERYRMDETSALNLRSFLVRMRESTGCGLPGRHRVVIEAYRDSVRQGEGTALIFHTLWGSGANLPLALALGEAWTQSYGNEVESFSDNDCVILVLSDPDPEAAERAAGLLRGIAASRSLEALLKKRLESSGFFGALFRENAGRSLLLPKAGYGKRMPLWWTRMRSKKLLDAIMEYPDFPVLIETWRTAFQDYFDMEILSSILSEIDSGETELACCDTAAPSPFSQGVIFQTTGAYIYRGDELEKSRVSNLSNDLIREAVLHSRLRPELDPRIVAEWVKKLKRLISGYAPASREELIDWAKERLIIPFDEWLSLVSLLGEELKDSFASDTFLRKRIILAELRFGGEGNQSRLFILAAENLPRICGSLGLSADQVRLFDLSMRPEGMSGLTDLEGALRELPEEERKSLSTELGGMDEESFDGASLSSLLAELLRFEGPVPLGELESILPVPGDELDAALSSLVAEERLFQDVIVRGSETLNLCDADNLDILLRLSRRKARPFVQARPLECLVPFLASYQGLVSSSSPDGLKAVLEKLFGYPLDAGLWEGDIFPSRLQPYYTPLLDGLLSEGRLRWFGCGEGRVSFCIEEDYELFREAGEINARSASSLLKGLPGTYDFFSLRKSCASADECMRRLWSDVWDGVLSCEGFSPLRSGLLSGFSFKLGAGTEADWGVPSREKRRAARSAAGRWGSLSAFSGKWFSLSLDDDGYDEIDREEIGKDRVRQLLSRYGIIFRELLARELPLLRYGVLARTLRIMELSGEIVSGRFFDGIDGPQFMTPASLAALESLGESEEVYWMNAADPASLCGLGLLGLPFALPQRIPTNHVVFKGTAPLLISRRLGKELEFFCGPDEPALASSVRLFSTLTSRSFNPLPSVKVELINGEPSAKSPYAQSLIEEGFVNDYRGLAYRGGLGR